MKRLFFFLLLSAAIQTNAMQEATQTDVFTRAPLKKSSFCCDFQNKTELNKLDRELQFSAIVALRTHMQHISSQLKKAQTVKTVE